MEGYKFQSSIRQQETAYPYFANQKLSRNLDKLNKYLPYETEQASNFNQKNSFSKSMFKRSQFNHSNSNEIDRNKIRDLHPKNYRKSLQKRLERLFKQQKDIIQERYSLKSNTNLQDSLKGKQRNVDNRGSLDIIAPKLNLTSMSVQKMQMKIKLLEEKYKDINNIKSCDIQTTKGRQVQGKSLSKNRKLKRSDVQEDQGFSFQIPRNSQIKNKADHQRKYKQKSFQQNKLRKRQVNTPKLEKQVQLLKIQFQEVKDFYQFLYAKNQEKQKKQRKSNECKILLKQISKKLEAIKTKIKLKNKVEKAQAQIQSQQKNEGDGIRYTKKGDKRLLYEIQELNSRLKNEFRKRQQAEQKTKWALSQLDQIGKPSQLPLHSYQ